MWKWKAPQRDSFKTLKEKLTTSPILKHSQVKMPYIIKSDARNFALGAVLLQAEGKDEHPIEYASQ